MFKRVDGLGNINPYKKKPHMWELECIQPEQPEKKYILVQKKIMQT